MHGHLGMEDRAREKDLQRGRLTDIVPGAGAGAAGGRGGGCLV